MFVDHLGEAMKTSREVFSSNPLDLGDGDGAIDPGVFFFMETENAVSKTMKQQNKARKAQSSLQKIESREKRWNQKKKKMTVLFLCAPFWLFVLHTLRKKNKKRVNFAEMDVIYDVDVWSGYD